MCPCRAIRRSSTAASAAFGSASSRTCSTRRQSIPASPPRRGGDRRARRARRAVEHVDAAFAAARGGRCSSSSCSRRRPRRTSPGCALGSPTTAPDVRARLLAGLLLPSHRRRSPASARVAALVDEARPLFERLRPARRARDADRRAADRRGHGRVGGARTALPAGADPVQLALELSRPARRRACRAASSTASPSALRSSGRRFEEATVLRRGPRVPGGDRLAPAEPPLAA